MFRNLGILTVGGEEENLNSSMITRINTYLKRFPEVEYLIDMITSSTIYTSSSNSKKIKVSLSGDYTVPKKIETDATVDSTEAEKELVTDVEVQFEKEKVDTWYNELNEEVNSLFMKNNIKLSLYDLVSSMIKYGCGIFYIPDKN